MQKNNRSIQKGTQSNRGAKNSPSQNGWGNRVDRGRDALVNSIALKLQKMPHSLFRKDLDYWAAARALALNPQLPRRWTLIEMYMDTMMDLHLSGILEKRVLKVSNKKIKVTENGEKNDAATDLLRKEWFKDFTKESMYSKAWGYSPIEFAGDDAIVSATILDRRFVLPEWGIFITDIGEMQGYDYTQPPFDTCFLFIGKSNDLGLLLKLSLYATLKKNAIGNWSEFMEIFGIPLRYAETPSVDKNVRQNIEDMLDQMGGSAWAVVPQGTNLKVQEGAKTDAFKVFDAFIDRINSEMSIAVLGQTMTTTDGSSKAQGEVHERTEAEITMDDEEFMLSQYNDKLLPFLIKRGGVYSILKPTMKIEWEEGEGMNLKDRADIDLKITQMGKSLSDDYVTETYGVELEEQEEPTEQEPILEEDPSNPKRPNNPKAKPKKKDPQVIGVKYNDIKGAINKLYKDNQ